MRRGRAATVAILVSVGTVLASAQQPSPSPTVGEIVLLANSADAVAAGETLSGALRSADPAVRLAAARVIAAGNHKALRPALISALAREQNPAAGAELVRGILHLSGPADLAFVEPQAKRFGAPGMRVLAEWLARVQPEQFAQRLPQLVAASTTGVVALSDIVSMAAAQHGEHADSILRSWMAVAPDGGWDAVLSSAYGLAGVSAADAAVVGDALNSSRPIVREETVWFLVDAVVRQHPVPGPLIEKAAAPREDATAWEAFGRALLERGGKPAAGGGAPQIVRTEGERHMPDLYRIQTARQLTPSERQAVLALAPLVGEPDGLDSETPPGSTLRTIPAMAPRAAADTLAAAKCRPRSEGFALAAVSYGPDGMPAHIQIDPTGLSDECRAAWSALARTIAAAPAEPARSDRQQRIVLPFNPSFLGCGQDDAPEAVSTPAVKGIRQPRKIRDIPPIYPPEAASARVQGVIIVKAVVAEKGCVSEVRVVRTIPLLDIAALVAVSGWQYEPTLLNGTPVRVALTAIVSFALAPTP